MTENIASSQVASKRSRPFGVWIFTIYAFLFAGLAPLLLSIFVLFTGYAIENADRVLITIPINIAVIVNAFGAWQGKEKSRKFLLAFITINYVLIAVNNLWILAVGDFPPEQMNQYLGRIFRGILYPAIYFWYFNKATTKTFYQ